ncbi:tripartite tricarboxylate transporter TctB family protein [Bacillus sp. JJ1521]|uniref:tripartite tricarboxylate transporter TctB family protein n=1 Tax=Bacillus sp. JJ1521 TaxID=3122957 RepID=UPI00300007CB
MKKLNSGVWAGTVLLIISIIFLIESFKLPYKNEMGPGPGPGFFPIWLSGTMVILSIIYLLNSAKKGNKDENWPKGEALKNILLIIFSMCIFIILLPAIGFVLTSLIFLLLLLYKAYKWYISLAISAGLSICLFLLFKNVLGVPLPVNGLGF